MTEPLYIQESLMIDDLLKEFQTNKTHIAVVVDEYGGTVGVVTMEDIFEELARFDSPLYWRLLELAHQRVFEDYFGEIDDDEEEEEENED